MKTSKNMSNREVSQLLNNVAIALSLKNKNRFRIIAYEKAALAISELDRDIKELWQEDKLTKLSGIGTNIAGHLSKLFKTGKVKHFERLFKGLPEALFELIKVPGIGPKVALKLCREFNIKDKKNALIRIKKIALDRKIRNLPGFGEKSEDEILTGLKELSQRSKKILLIKADKTAEKILAYLRENKAVYKACTLGSLRRRAELVGDVDIAVASNEPKKVIDWFLKFPGITRVLESGTTKATILVQKEIQIDLRVINPDSFGSMLQHFTGSKQHNIRLRELALKKGLSLSEYGIKKNKKLLKFKKEKDFYHFLGLKWIAPELRENKGEIPASRQNKLPKLVNLKDIKGDLHVHSSFDIESSHDLGQDSMIKMVQKAAKLGYHYIAFAEHNPSISKHSSKMIFSLIKRKKILIDKLKYSNSKSTQQKVFAFNSIEVDIRPNGSLALEQKALDVLDFATASIHSSFRMSKNQMTKRVLTALSNPKVKILGHPTGRLLLKRPAYELDWDKVFDYCVKNKKMLEINANPKRLDLSYNLIKLAIKNKVKMVINSDSHSLLELELMKYGVDTARRGWAEKSDILNTLSYNKISKYLLS